MNTPPPTPTPPSLAIEAATDQLLAALGSLTAKRGFVDGLHHSSAVITMGAVMHGSWTPEARQTVVIWNALAALIEAIRVDQEGGE